MRKRERERELRRLLREIPFGMRERIAASGVDAVPTEIWEQAHQRASYRDLQAVHRKMWRAMQLGLCVNTKEFGPEDYAKRIRELWNSAALYALTSTQVLRLLGHRAPHPAEPSPLEKVYSLLMQLFEMMEIEDQSTKK